MNLTQLRWALDQFDDTDHNDDQIVLIQRTGENFSLGVLHADGPHRPYDELPNSHIDYTFNYTTPQKEEPTMPTTYIGPDDARAEAIRRISGALNAEPPTEEQVFHANAVTNAFVDLMQTVLQFTPNGRDQAIALTAIEDAKMRAIKAIFSDEEPV